MGQGLRRAILPLALFALFALCGAAPAIAAVPWSFDGELGAGYDSNVGNAGTDPDTQGVGSLYAGAGANWRHPFSLYTALQFRAGLDGEEVLDLDKLSSLRASLRLRLLHKPGEGFYVPVLAAWGSVGERHYGSEIRSSTDYRGGVYLVEPLTTAVQARVEVRAAKRVSEGRVFDLDSRTWLLGVDWSAAPWLSVYGEYRADHGGIVVTAFDDDGSATPKTQHKYLQTPADAIEPDEAFGSGWFAYRLPGGSTRIATLGANVPLAADLALDMQVQRADSSAWGFSYGRWLGSLSLLKRF